MKKIFCRLIFYGLFFLNIQILSSHSSLKLDQTQIDFEQNTSKEVKFEEDIGEIFQSNDLVEVQILTPKRIIIKAKDEGTCVFRIKNRTGKILVQGKFYIQKSIKELRQIVYELFPNLKISLEIYEGIIFVTGKVQSPKIKKDVIDVINRHATKLEIKVKDYLIVDMPIQVMTKVKLVRFSRDVVKGFGIEWIAQDSYNGNGSDSASNRGMTGGFVANIAQLKTLDFATGLTNTELSPNNGLFMQWKYSKGKIKIDAASLLNALESEGFATTLCEPRIVSLSGEQGTFKSGTWESYVNFESKGGVSGTAFENTGPEITITPTVYSENLINLNVNITLKSILPSNASIGVSTSEITFSGNVHCANGQSVVLAGLIKKTGTSVQKKDSFLSLIPIIGDLFTSKSFGSNEDEVVIVLTPYIVKPMQNSTSPVEMISSDKYKFFGKINENVSIYDIQDGISRDYKNNVGQIK